VVLAVPVGAAEIVGKLSALADEVVCAATPARLLAVGRHYADFAEVPDEEVQRLLGCAGR
jgi:putative phosphoribosyl transferase